MTEIQLTYTEIMQVQSACANLKISPGISDLLSTHLHRSEKKLSQVAEQVKTEIENLVEKYKQKLKDNNPGVPEDKIEPELEDQQELVKSLRKLQNQDKFAVEVHLMKVADFPKSKEDFGQREIQKKIDSRDKGENVLSNTVYFYDFFLELLDVLILEEQDYKDKVDPKKK